MRNIMPPQMACNLVSKATFDHEGVCDHKGFGARQFFKRVKSIITITDFCFTVKLSHNNPA